MIFKEWCAPALVVAAMIVAAGSDATQSRSTLPADERFVQKEGLRIRLAVRTSTVKAFEDPEFSVVFENVGKTPVFVNPVVASNLFIYDANGRLVPPSFFDVADSLIPGIGRAQLVRLDPGRRRSVVVRPEHHLNGQGIRAAYTVTANTFALRGGRYTARFVYFNYPDYPARYDPRQVAEIWEGQQESEPVGFTVASGAEEKLEQVKRVPPDGHRSTERAPADAEHESVRGHCELSDLPLLLRRFDTRNDQVMEALGLCGDAATFHTLRRYLTSTNAAVRYRANHALRALTFTTDRFDDVPARGTQADWDAWHRTHGGGTRAEWAVQRLQAPHENPSTAVSAIAYLLRLRDQRWLPELRRAATSEHYELRIAAARAIAHWDRAEGLDLLRRELQNRQLAACESAAVALDELTQQTRRFDFKVSAERQRAIDTYARVR